MHGWPGGPSERPVVVGHDVGATRAVTLGRTGPDRHDDHRAEFWDQDFHQLAVCADLCDGNPAAVRSYLHHFWSHWANRPDAVLTEELVEAYSRPGAFTAALNWYRSGSATAGVLDDVGHFTPLEAAAEMAAAVRDFLQEK